MLFEYRYALEREKVLLLDAVSASQHELQQRIQMWKEIETDVKDGSKVHLVLRYPLQSQGSRAPYCVQHVRAIVNVQALLERLAKESSVNAHLSQELRTASMRLETAEASRNHLHERLKQIESECAVSVTKACLAHSSSVMSVVQV